MEWVELGDAFIIIKNGKSIKQYGEDGYPITRIETIADRYVDETRVGYASIYNLEEYKDYILQKGDILMSHINSVKHLAKTAIFNSKSILIHGMNLLCLRADKNIIDPYYGYYYLNSDVFLKQIPQITKNSVNQASFSITNLKKLKIPVPPIEIQKQIVEVLDEAQKLIDNRKKQIELLDDLIESIFYDMFGDPVKNDKGWEVKKLGKVSNIKSLDIEDKYKDDDLVWLLNLDEIESNTGKLLERKQVKFSDLPSSIISFNENYVLYSKLRPYLNKLILPDKEGYATSELVPILPKKYLNKVYLFNLLRSDPILKFLEIHVSGAKMPRVVMKDFRNLEIPIPPIQLQNQFAEKVQAIEKQKELLKESLKLMEDNYNSLMQRAFKGELF